MPTTGGGSTPTPSLQTPATVVPEILKYIDGLVQSMTDADKAIVFQSLKAHCEERLAS
jgi:hypothetical protein